MFSEIVQFLKPNSNIFIHGGAATPNCFLEVLKDITFPITLYSIHTMGSVDYLNNPNINVKTFFVGANIRHLFDSKRIDYIPCTLSQISQLFKTKKISLDLAILHTSVPDKKGFMSLGTSVDIALSAMENAKTSFAICNPEMPWVFGSGIVHESCFQFKVNNSSMLMESLSHPLTEEEIKIGQYIAELVEDGSTIQTGIGSIPDAALESFINHKNLGVHSEMYSDGVMHLIQKGVVTNSEKKNHKGKTVGSFAMGSKSFYQFLNQNPNIIHLESSYVNNPTVIAENPKVVSINSAIEIDLTGQVCADSVGSKIISGTGGQMDFILGASWSENGKAIIAFPSQSKGRSKIVKSLTPASGVVTPRAYVQYVVTEYGVANLFGKSLDERAKELTRIAHPNHRDALR